jgi:hypothetical protein
MKTLSRIYWFPVALTVWLAAPAVLIVPDCARGQTRDMINGNAVQFDDNGIWTWYSDERTVVDTNGNKLVVGCVENAAGLGGLSRDGDINVTIWDVQSGMGPRYLLHPHFTSDGGGDDHNAPGLLAWPNGHYLAMYTGHNSDMITLWRTYDPVAGVWSPEGTNNWANIVPGGDNFNTTYSNPWYLSSQGKTYDYSRGNNRSPNAIMSTDFGNTWTWDGELTTNDNVGYVNGYFKYWGNGVDRIDFICTEYHPRDYSVSMYHGYISNGMSFNSFGTVMDTNVYDQSPKPKPQYFTPVFLTGTVMPPGQTNYRTWNDDLCRYPDGTIECIIAARINNNVTTSGSDQSINPDHAFFFCRFDGTKWTPTYLCQAGYKLYAAEGDYVGLGCLNPNDPNTIYISTKYDPRAVQPGVTDTNPQYSTNHEIWKGITTNNGTSFTWTPITQNSVSDNLRPIMPTWDNNDSALLWFRGYYYSAQSVDGTVLGIVEHRSEVVGQMHYVDATTNNTFLTNGSPLILSSAANQWHSQTGVGNGGTVISSADSIAEKATNLMTQITVPGPGTYDVWVDFWGTATLATNLTGGDWRIQAGLTPGNMQVYRSDKCEQVQPWTQDTTLVLTNNSTPTNYLYQAYVGRVAVTNNYTINVLVGDWPYQTGTGTLAGDTNRTWYDGISYAKVNPFQIQQVYSSGPSAITLVWNSPPPEMSLTTPTYTLQKTTSLNPPVTWTTVATGIPATSMAYTTTNTDNSATDSAAFYRVTWP